MTRTAPSPFSSRRGRRWLTLPPAWPVVFLLLSFVLALLLWGQGAGTVYAETLDGLRIGTAYPQPTPCMEREELASVMQAEGGAQPLDTQIALMQIVKREADARGLTICALTRVTNFVNVRHYADAHPASWTAAQFANPHDWALDLAQAVLLGEYPDMTNGAGHFDGDGTHILFKP